MQKRTWVLGDTKEGYSVIRGQFRTEPWLSQVWLNGRITRTDRHRTREGAVRHCRQRARAFGRGLKAR